MVPEAGPALETPATHSMYLKLIDAMRKAVAIAMAVFGLGFVICANLDPGHGTDFGPRTRLVGIGFVIGVYACLIAVLVLIVEHLARPAKPTPFTLRSVFVRSLFILVTVVAIYLSMTFAYGPWQAIGAVIGTFLVLAAVREHRIDAGRPCHLGSDYARPHVVEHTVRISVRAMARRRNRCSGL